MVYETACERALMAPSTVCYRNLWNACLRNFVSALIILSAF